MSVKNMCTMCTMCTQHSGFAQVTSPFHLPQVRCKSVLNPFPMFGDILDASPGIRLATCLVKAGAFWYTWYTYFLQTPYRCKKKGNE